MTSSQTTDRSLTPKIKTPVLPVAGAIKIATRENVCMFVKYFITPKLTSGGWADWMNAVVDRCDWFSVDELRQVVSAI